MICVQICFVLFLISPFLNLWLYEIYWSITYRQENVQVDLFCFFIQKEHTEIKDECVCVQNDCFKKGWL